MYLGPLGIPYVFLIYFVGFLSFVDAWFTRKFRLVYLFLMYVVMILLIYDAAYNLPVEIRGTAGIFIFMAIVSFFVPAITYLGFLERETFRPWVSEYETKTYPSGFKGLDIVYYVFSVNPKAVVLVVSIPAISIVVWIFYTSFLWMLRDQIIWIREPGLASTINACLLVSLLVVPLMFVSMLVLGLNTLWRVYGDEYKKKLKERVEK